MITLLLDGDQIDDVLERKPYLTYIKTILERENPDEETRKAIKNWKGFLDKKSWNVFKDLQNKNKFACKLF